MLDVWNTSADARLLLQAEFEQQAATERGQPLLSAPGPQPPFNEPNFFTFNLHNFILNSYRPLMKLNDILKNTDLERSMAHMHHPAVESQLEYPVHTQPVIRPFLSLIPYKSLRSDQSDA